MKKALLIVALIVAYGVSMANISTQVVNSQKSELTIVADNDVLALSIEEEEKKKTKKETKKACCSSATATTAKTGCAGTTAAAKPATVKAVGEKPSTGCSDAQKKSCAASGKTCDDAKATTTAKKACCGSK